MPFIAAQQLALNNAIRVKLSHLYQTRPRDTLWYSFGLKMLLDYKSVVRSWAMGRSRVAFRKALAERGYDQDGRAISSFPRAATEETKIAGLRGSVDFTVREEVVTAKSSDIEKDMREIVDKIIRVMLHAPKAGTGKLKQLYSLRSSTQSAMLVSLTVGKVDAGVAVLLTQDNRLIEFPSVLLPNNITSGSIVDITVARNHAAETASATAFQTLQKRILNTYGIKTPTPPILRLRNATQTSLVLEWDPIDLATASLKSLSLYRNGSKAGSIPRPLETRSTKISGLAIHTEYTFHLVLRTTAGTYQSEKLVCRTHKMTDLSGITVTAGVLHPQQRDALAAALDRIGGKLIDTVRIDTTHFVCTEGRGPLWEKAVEMNIPVVVPEWVDACEAEGTIVSVRGYYLNADPKARQLGPIHGSTQHQRTTSTATPNQSQDQNQNQSPSPSPSNLAPSGALQVQQQLDDPPLTPFPGAEMTGQPTAEEREVSSDEGRLSPPPPVPPKDDEEEARGDEHAEDEPPAQEEHDTAEVATPADAKAGDSDHDEQTSTADDQSDRHIEEDKGKPSGDDEDKERHSKEGEGDFNEVPL
ncbi:chitin biosynthesis protein [Aspergillus aculeatinus CBS 121060]|uniref:Chitin biosynthesis protein n=1 Tax=Aspergillus aculeatinus CBS 121060 TaxID=1448322 RepID=A0ACD1H059_9EURO|nr:chitin biosynthesis protein [Aspergillus aculeatinus CBS 121060]RAH66816.1 chitin biosynthesis protein [Aspergillus aculeatinus CBS 121060]